MLQTPSPLEGSCFGSVGDLASFRCMSCCLMVSMTCLHSKRQSSLFGRPQEGSLLLKLVHGKVVSGTVVLDEFLGLVEAHTQRVPKLGVGNSFLPIKLDEVQLTCLPVKVRPVRSDLLLDVLR